MNSNIALSVTLVLLVFGGPVQANDHEARSLVESSGIQGGLIAHIGCGDGRLTAALRTSNSFLVHGLDADVDNVAQARAMSSRLNPTDLLPSIS